MDNFLYLTFIYIKLDSGSLEFIDRGIVGLAELGTAAMQPIECVPYPLAGRRHHDNTQTNKPSQA